MEQQQFNAQLIKPASLMRGEKMMCYGHICHLQPDGKWYADIPNDGRLQAQVLAGHFVEINSSSGSAAVNTSTQTIVPTHSQSLSTIPEDLNTMPLAKLKEMAEQMGIPGASNMKKPDLIQLIQSQPSYGV